MRRKIFAVLLSAVLCLSFAVPALAEGEGLFGGLLGGLLGGAGDLGGALEGVGQAVEGLIPEGIDAGGFLEGLIPDGADVGGFFEGLIPDGADVGGFLEGLIPDGADVGGFFEGLIPDGNEIGGFLEGLIPDGADVGGFLEGLLPDGIDVGGILKGLIPGGGDPDALNAACEAHVKAEYAELLDAGDVQIVVAAVAAGAEQEDGTQKVLGLFGLENYAAEGNELRLMNFAATPELMTVTRNADGSYEVTETKWTTDGDDFSESFAALCAEIGADSVDYAALKAEYDRIEAARICDLLEAHPEYEKIEYMGEMKTPEEMAKICGELTDAGAAGGK